MHVYTSYKPHFRTHHSEEKLQVVSMLNRLLHFYTFFVWSRIFSLYILIKKMSVDGWWILMDYVSTRPYDWSLSASEKHNQENKVHKTLPNLWISKINVCAMFDNQKILLLWTIFISLELLYIINKPLTYVLTVWSAFHALFACLNVLHTQRIIGLFILITD